MLGVRPRAEARTALAPSNRPNRSASPRARSIATAYVASTRGPIAASGASVGPSGSPGASSWRR